MVEGQGVINYDGRIGWVCILELHDMQAHYATIRMYVCSVI